MRNAPEKRSPRQSALIALVVFLAVIAVYLWSAPYRRERFYQTATIERLQAAARREAGNGRLHGVLGQRLLAGGRPAEARDALQKAAEADGQSAEIWIAWATAADAAGDTVKAQAILLTFANVHPDDKTIPLAQARFFEAQGKAALQEGDLRWALALFRRAAERDPARAETHYQLALIYYRQGFTDEAMRYLETATRLEPANALYWDALGQTLQSKMEKFGDAETALQRAVTLDPKNGTFLLDLGAIQAKSKKPLEAEANYRKALAAEPDNLAARFWLGRLLVENNTTPPRLTEAEDLLESVAAADPSHAGAMFDLGRLALRQKRPADAVRWLELAVVLSPRNQYARFQLARAYQQAGDTKRAAQTRATFDALSQQERDRTNIELQAVQSKNDPVLRLKLARLLAQSCENAKAINQYRVYLSHDPKNDSVRHECAAFESRLRAEGRYPDMSLFDALMTGSEK